MMDEATRAAIRAADSNEKAAARKRRFRARRKAEIDRPRTAPRTASGVPEYPSMVSDENGTVSITGAVICGHCKRLFPDVSTGTTHLDTCAVRLGQQLAKSKTGECCMDSGKDWPETPCLCDCHYPQDDAWTMTEGGFGLPPHRHRDTAGRCNECGAER